AGFDPAAGSCGTMVTQHNNNGRVGANLCERQLRPSNVNGASFGKLFSRAVDGQIYAQPLYVPGLQMPRHGIRNVVFVATMHNTLYAFDADDPAASTPLWRTNFGAPFLPSAVAPDYRDIEKEVGILSTPTIDLASRSIYVVQVTKERDGRVHHRLHRLDLTTGKAKQPAAEIGASVPADSPDSVNGRLTFNSFKHNQRTALLLDHGRIWFGCASYGDHKPYHGWVFAYDAETLRLAGAWVDTPHSMAGGIWQSGQGLSADANGDVYVATGNGMDTNAERERVESMVRLRLTKGGIQVIDWYTPADWRFLDKVDLDMGSTGVVLIPGTNLAVAGSKAGYLYSTDRDNMGRIGGSGVQSWRATTENVHGTPIFYDDGVQKQLYVWGEEDHLRAYGLFGTTFATTPGHQSLLEAPDGMPGGILSLSANGKEPGTGVIWANVVLSGNANQATRPGVLRAFDSRDVTQQLWSSEDNHNRDSFGNFAKFVPPSVANGKVYMATFSNKLVVYGLLQPPKAPRLPTNEGLDPEAPHPDLLSASSAFELPSTSIPSEEPTSALLTRATSALSTVTPWLATNTSSLATVTPSRSMNTSSLSAVIPSVSTSTPRLTPVTPSQTTLSPTQPSAPPTAAGAQVAPNLWLATAALVAVLVGRRRG
ncbi:MAG TPA: hypothetical protein VFH51_17210, partial [Myxococcota bacterium]|nr:hypothetical protein [Myxococcota bacterium]